MSKPQVKLVNLGLKSYLPTWKIQQKLVEKVKNDRKSENFLVLVEHNPVFTTGIRTNVYDSKWVILPIVFFYNSKRHMYRVKMKTSLTTRRCLTKGYTLLLISENVSSILPAVFYALKVC